MSRYWFLSATLPGLLFGATPPMSGDEFLILCERNMSPEDYAETVAAIGYLSSDQVPEKMKSSFLSSFVAWERTFRNGLARLRARRQNSSEDEFIRPSKRSDEAESIAASCFAIDDPYQAELNLERERWNAIERLSSLSSFDLDFIIAYRLKLAINERLERLNAETGSVGYRRLYDDILDKASRTAETDNLGEKA